MNDDYLSLAAELVQSGTWDRDTFLKRVTLYANEKNIDINAINDFCERVVGKEYSLNEKRSFLSVLTLNGEELKYGNAVETMKDDMVERFYKMETSSLSRDKIEEYHVLASKKSNSVVQIEEKEYEEPVLLNVEEQKKEEVVLHSPNSANDENKVIRARIVKEDKSIDLPVRIVNRNQEIEEKQSQDELFEENVFNMPEPVLEEKIVVTNNNSVEPVLDTPEESSKENSEKNDDNNLETVIPPLLLTENDYDMPHTEEEFKKQDDGITKKEKDSSVRKIQISPERLAKLKKTKSKVINYFLKAAVVVVGVHCLGPLVGGGLILGYSYFAEEIKAGTFNPNNPVGKAVKYAVEKVMYMGMNNDKEKGGMAK